ncbi:hypothetical protein DFH29DRAFT_1009014 [Suillus ampliporus]|nr:hypothetical protein DFH29DRAFT_1009014 [Suillus ampliporus]
MSTTPENPQSARACSASVDTDLQVPTSEDEIKLHKATEEPVVSVEEGLAKNM